MIDRNRVRDIREKLDATLRAFGTANGVAVSLGAMRYADEIKVQLIINMPQTSPVTENVVTPFARLAPQYGLRPEDENREITFQGRQVKIVEIKPGRPKYPIIIQGSQGGRYKAAAADIVRAIGRSVVDPSRPVSETEIITELRSIENQLSPENLHMDGEISVLEARRRGVELQRRRAVLIGKLGREPGFQELFG